MSVHTFAGQPIWGAPTSTIKGPTGKYRAMREFLPGVDGARIYRLGRDPIMWTVRGRVTGLSMASLIDAIEAGVSLENGQLYTFVDSAGNSYNNCLLSSFGPIGEFEGCTMPSAQSAVTVIVQGVIEWMSPSGYWTGSSSGAGLSGGGDFAGLGG